MRRLAGVAAVAMLVAASACGSPGAEEVGSAERPFVLLLSPHHGAEESARDGLAAALSASTGMVIEVVAASDGRAAVVRAGTDRFDAAILPVFDYLLCRRQYGVEPGLQALRAGGATSYRGELLVRTADGPETLAELEGRPVGFVDPYSTSGFVFPAARLAEAGVKVEAVFLGSHEAALEALGAGRVDAAGTYGGAAGTRSDLGVLAQTAVIPNEPVFFRPRLPTSVRAKFVDGLVALGGTAEGRALLEPFAGIQGFRPADPTAWEPIDATLRAAGRRIEDVVPQGWRIRHEAERPMLDELSP